MDGKDEADVDQPQRRASINCQMTKRRINRAICHTGLHLDYVRGDGVFHFYDEDESVVGEPVYAAYLNQLSLEQWVEEAEARGKEGG